MFLAAVSGFAQTQTQLSQPPQVVSALSPPASRHFDGSLAQVHDKLQLTDTQAPLWADYVARLDEYSRVFYGELPAAAYRDDAAPRQIGRLTDKMQVRLAVRDEIEGAAKALYAVLSPEQKKTADQLLITTIPVFASSSDVSCPAPVKSKSDRSDSSQHQHRNMGSGTGTFGP